MVEFSIQGLISMIGQTLFAGNTTLAGLAVMLAIFFVCVIILAAVGSNPTYAVIPMIPLALLFTTMGIVDTSLGFLIIIVTALVTAMEVRKMVTNTGG